MIYDERPNGDEVLRRIQQEESEKNSKKGKLKIFFGYAAGVGKTYSMLSAAHEAKAHGIDVVIGYIEPHSRPETSALINGLESIKPKRILYKKIVLNEFDIDAAIARHPEIILVDELAHSNAEGCRHSKRYQDVEELLNAGINVYTTVNVQHLESLNDQVATITGIKVNERIPDYIFDDADKVELVDIDPLDLITRLKEGKIYKKTQSISALSNFFVRDNLSALREISLRRCADRMNLNVHEKGKNAVLGGYTNDHILVCLSSAPSNARIIRTASRLAFAYRARFTALYVELTNAVSMSEENKKRLDNNIKLARQLGATIETVYGDDIASTIANFARQFRVSKIVVGRSGNRSFLGLNPTLVDKLIKDNGDLDIYIIPDKNVSRYKQRRKIVSRKIGKDNIKDLITTIATTSFSTLFCFILYHFGLTDVNIVTIYIFGVLINGLLTEGIGFSVLSSLLSVLAFNYFFTYPRYTFDAYGFEYPFTFLIMFLSGFFTSTLAKKLKSQSKKATDVAYRTKLLFELNRVIQKCDDEDGIIEVTATQIKKLLNKNIIYYPVVDSRLQNYKLFVSNPEAADVITSEDEKTVAKWVCLNNASAGATTDTLSCSKCLYYSVRVNDTVYGVLGIEMAGQTSFVGLECNLTLAMLGEAAIAIEKYRVEKEREKARTIARNEQMKTNILRAISHDLRTPLSCISGNADLLLHQEGKSFLSKDQRSALITSIHEDSMYLINLVENLLSVSRIEDGSLRLRLSPEVIDEVIDEAVRHTSHYGEKYNIKVNHNEEIIVALMDAHLIVQVIINLIDNAIKYSGENAEINIYSKVHERKVYISVSDNGPGVPDGEKDKIFEMFYTAHGKVSDSRRSMGLGLSLCKSIITSHGGEIMVTDNNPKGAVFTFSLPLEEAISE